MEKKLPINVSQGSLKDSLTPFRSEHECVLLDLLPTMTLMLCQAYHKHIWAKLFKIFHNVKRLWRTYNPWPWGQQLGCCSLQIVSWWGSFVPSYFKTFKLSISYREEMKNRCSYIGSLSLTLTFRVVTWVLCSLNGVIMVIISAKFISKTFLQFKCYGKTRNVDFLTFDL
jgi:hypothetical protein